MFLRLSGKSVSQSSTVLGCFEESRGDGSIGVWAEEMQRESEQQSASGVMHEMPTQGGGMWMNYMEGCDYQNVSLDMSSALGRAQY